MRGLFGFTLEVGAGVVPGFPPRLEIVLSPNFFHFLLILISIFELSLLLLQGLGVSHGRNKVPFLVPAIGMNLGSLGGLSTGLPCLSGQTITVEVPVRGWREKITVLGS